MTDLQAALGLSQLSRLSEFIDCRRKLAARYDALLAPLPCTLQWQHPDGQSSWHLYVIRLNTEDLQVNHRDVFDSLRNQGIGVNLHYIPIHLQPFYKQLLPNLRLPAAEKYYEEAISLPLHFQLSHEDQDRVVNALRQALQQSAGQN
jgi:dTDP-4-amino-4,6-dideoxygalactose transaminase